MTSELPSYIHPDSQAIQLHNHTEEAPQKEKPQQINYPVTITFQTRTAGGAEIDVCCQATAKIPFHVDGNTLTFAAKETQQLARAGQIQIEKPKSFFYAVVREGKRDPWTQAVPLAQSSGRQLSEEFLAKKLATAPKIIKGIMNADMIDSINAGGNTESGLFVREFDGNFGVIAGDRVVTFKGVGKAIIIFSPTPTERKPEELAKKTGFFPNFKVLKEQFLGIFGSNKGSAEQTFLQLFPLLLTLQTTFNLTTEGPQLSQIGDVQQSSRRLDMKMVRRFLPGIVANNLKGDDIYNPESIEVFLNNFRTYLAQAEQGIVV